MARPSRSREGTIDVSAKTETLRTATARATLRMAPATLSRIRGGRIPKGDALGAARVAALQAAKRTPELFPHCHPLRVTAVAVSVAPKGRDRVEVEAEVRAVDRTGVEMEALTAAAVGALTVYDMAKAFDPGMIVADVRLLRKTGGKSDFAAAGGAG